MASNVMLFSMFLHFLTKVPFKFLKKIKYPSSVPTKTNKTSMLNCPPNTKAPLDGSYLSDKTLLCHLDSALLRSSYTFPYFMLVAFEGGSLFRSFLLLLTYPLLCLVNEELRFKIMVFVSFCGIRKEGFNVGRSVLPKFFLEDVDFGGFQVLMSAKKKVVFSLLPKVMIEEVLIEYLGVDHVVGSELGVVGKYYTGFVEAGSGMGNIVTVLKNFFGDNKADVGLEHVKSRDYCWLSICKEAYMVGGSEKKALPRDKYPKPLIFHDGRLAFRPTPVSTLIMFIWLPFGLVLAIWRMLIGIILPYNLQVGTGALCGLGLKLKLPNNRTTPQEHGGKGTLYVCSHRTLLDPLFLAVALQKPISAVTYSLSRFSEILAPIKTVRLSRNRDLDGQRMRDMLSKGDLVVCPEGTTCREPYLLRFSPLFAELTDEIVPVAVNVSVSMFYGTTASGFKALDPVFFLMNPLPTYNIEILERMTIDEACKGCDRKSCEVANYVQMKLAEAMGFECTKLTRKEKYLVLAGNEGIVKDKQNNLKKGS